MKKRAGILSKDTGGRWGEVMCEECVKAAERHLCRGCRRIVGVGEETGAERSMADGACF